ncbi:hypothetical protein AURDEDRAFT_155519 [Auricularia subglabra TFB-10046 SS5]|nr:hypothetical protein AURDEDRAFT_155519 [Auricularia subglabra TFB-10046 SS5]
MADNEHLRQLLVLYPAAITDFFGSGTLPPPQDRTSKAPIWLPTLKSIVAFLDSLDVNLQLTAVDPLAYANAGQTELFCDFIVVISVNPQTLAHADAVAAAPGVITILAKAGFSDVQVAFVEAVYRRRQAKFMGFDPISESESITKLRKPFTRSLGSLCIAPHNTLHYAGNGGVFIRLTASLSDKRVFLLTCAHPREDIVLCGTTAYDESLGDITKFIREQTNSIATWESMDGRKELTDLIAKAKKTITAANELHSAVTKNYSLTGSRILGFVYHCAEIGAGADDYLHDCALIQLDLDKLEAGDFLGNKLYVSRNKTAADWKDYMFPQCHDAANFHVPNELLLQLRDYNCDVRNTKTLLAVKNGRATGTTFGRVNGFESMTREYPNHGLKVDAIEVIVLGYDTKTGKNDRFSDEEDSGAMVVDRLGRLIEPITGGGGPTDAADKNHITPYHKLRKQFERQLETAHLSPFPCFRLPFCRSI